MKKNSILLSMLVVMIAATPALYAMKEDQNNKKLITTSSNTHAIYHSALEFIAENKTGTITVLCVLGGAVVTVAHPRGRKALSDTANMAKTVTMSVADFLTRFGGKQVLQVVGPTALGFIAGYYLKGNVGSKVAVAHCRHKRMIDQIRELDAILLKLDIAMYQTMDSLQEHSPYGDNGELTEVLRMTAQEIETILTMDEQTFDALVAQAQMIALSLRFTVETQENLTSLCAAYKTLRTKNSPRESRIVAELRPALNDYTREYLLSFDEFAQSASDIASSSSK